MKSSFVVALGVCAATIASPLLAGGPFDGLTRIPAAEMAQLRGGLEIGGLQMDLTARIRTYVDERLALATEMRIDRLAEGQQALQERLARIPGRAPESAGSIGNGPAPGKVAGSPEAPPPPLPVVTNESVGATTVHHVLSQRGLVSTVSNTASGRSVHQQVDVDVTVHNFSEFARHVRDTLQARAIGRLVGPR
jgi:hypothetical protein